MTREVVLDLGWLLVLTLLLPLAVAGTVMAFGALLAHRLYAWTRMRVKMGFAG